MNRIYFFVLFATLFWHTEQQACHTGQMDVCIAPTYFSGRRNLIPKDEKALSAACGMWQDMWKCLDDHTEKCFADCHRMMYKFAFQPQRRLFNELCDSNTDFRRDFLKNAPCMAEVSTAAHQYCMENIQSTVYTVTGDNFEDRVPAGCCYFQKFYNCYQQHLHKSCEKESYDFVNRASELMGLNTMKSFCSSYDPESDICIDYLNRNVTTPSEENSYLARMIVIGLKYY